MYRQYFLGVNTTTWGVSSVAYAGHTLERWVKVAGLGPPR